MVVLLVIWTVLSLALLVVVAREVWDWWRQRPSRFTAADGEGDR